MANHDLAKNNQEKNLMASKHHLDHETEASERNASLLIHVLMLFPKASLLLIYVLQAHKHHQ